jgi:pyruvyltransferase
MLGLGTNKLLKAYWWRPTGGPFNSLTGPVNFGDELGAVILRYLGFRVHRVPFAEAEYLLTGTMLDSAEVENPNLTVIGSGSGHTHKSEHNFNVLAVRGKLTADNLGVDVPLGDLGLLASVIWEKESPVYEIGVVRHCVDKDDYPFADIVIDATEPADTVVKKISSCRVVLSSSLHGCIVADSYGIPNMRIARDDVITGNWKWLDHETALTKPLKEVQDQLLDVLRQI